MSDDPKQDKDKDSGGKKSPKKVVLPRSGLAEDILALFDEDDLADIADSDEIERGPELAPSSPIAASTAPQGSVPPLDPSEQAFRGRDQLLEFADAVAASHNEPEERARRLETWVTFKVADQVFALPVTHVREVLRLDHITRVPYAPPLVRGITNVRGRVIPIIDVRERLALEARDPTEDSRVLVLDVAKRHLGFLVDAALRVVRVDMDQLEPPPADVVTERSDYILGITQQHGEITIALEVENVVRIHQE